MLSLSSSFSSSSLSLLSSSSSSSLVDEAPASSSMNLHRVGIRRRAAYGFSLFRLFSRRGWDVSVEVYRDLLRRNCSSCMLSVSFNLCMALSNVVRFWGVVVACSVATEASVSRGLIPDSASDTPLFILSCARRCSMLSGCRGEGVGGLVGCRCCASVRSANRGRVIRGIIRCCRSGGW